MDKIIDKIYHDPAGHGSMITTYEDVKKKAQSITDGDIQALFEVLLITMTEILKSWYPPPITIALISDEDVARIKAYFASFSLKFNFNVEELVGELRINNKMYLQQSKLEDMHFRVVGGGKIYTVRFSSLASR